MISGGESSNTSGWGNIPAATSGWGSSSSNSGSWNNNASSNSSSNNNQQPSFAGTSRTVTNGEVDSMPKPPSTCSSWAQAVSSGTNQYQQQQPQSSQVQPNNSGVVSRSHCDTNSKEVKGKPNESGSASDASSALKQDHSLHRSVPEPLLLDNWGQSVINQEKTWDLPPSPQESKYGQKLQDVSSKEKEMTWESVTPPTKTGTELWETSVRKRQQHAVGGQALLSSMTSLASNVQQTPCNLSSQAMPGTLHSNPGSSSQWNHHHTPTATQQTTGTWGEEEETSTSTAHWTGVPNQANGSSSHSSHSNASNGSWTGNNNAVPKNSEASESTSWRETSSDHEGNRSWANNSSNQSSWGADHSQRRVNDAASTTGWVSEPMQSMPPKQVVQQQPYKKETTSGWDQDTMNGDASGSASDDGTAVWGNPVRQQLKVRKWDDDQPSSSQSNPMNAKQGVNMTMMNSANGSVMTAPTQPGLANNNGSSHGLLPSSPGMIRLPNNPNNKANDWSSKQSNSRSWADQSSRETNSWGDSNNSDSRSSRTNWGDQSSHDSHGPSSPQGYWGQRNNPSWSDGQVDTSNWSGKQKPLTKEMIWASKQFRILTEQGCKKEEAEAALRSCNMNLEEAMNELRNWSHHDKKSPIVGNTPSPSSLLTGSGSGISINPSLANRNPNSNNVLPSVNEVTSALRAHPQRPLNLPSERQLLHLVKEIQIAVQSGHLQAQILNQPLAPPTIQLIYSLLQQIKHLQLLQSQLNKVPANMQSQIHIHITQTKQRIQGFQNQINIQQAIYMKNNSAPRGSLGSLGEASASSPNMTNLANPLSDFSDLSLKDQNQSRFETTWKRPSFDNKDIDQESVFRAASGKQEPSWKQQQDSWKQETSWSGLETSTLSSWSDGNDMFKDQEQTPSSTFSPPVFMADLGVPEFEPGKPWKGSQPRVEDDPHMTPGSVNRSPLSVSFNNWSSKVSPTETTANNESLNPLSLFSGTWAFSTPSSTTAFSEPLKTTQVPSSSWSSSSFGDNNSDQLWGSSSVGKTRGPPPGLSPPGQ